MIALSAIVIIVVWYYASLFTSDILGNLLHFSSGPRLALLIFVFLLPIIPEIASNIFFKMECENMEPAKYYIPKGTNPELLFNKDGGFKWKGFKEWKEIEAKLHGDESNLYGKTSFSATGFPFSFSVKSTIYKNKKTNAPVHEFKQILWDGFWLKFIYLGNSFQCFSPGWSVPDNKNQLVFE